MLILYLAMRADGNDKVSFIAFLFFGRSRQFDRRLARPNRVRKHEIFDAGERRSLNEALLSLSAVKVTIFFSHLVSLEQLVRRVTRLHNYAVLSI